MQAPIPIALIYTLIFFGFCDRIGPNQALTPRKQPAYQSVQFHDSEDLFLENEDDFDDEIPWSTTTPEFFKSEEFNWRKSVYRAESYAKANIAGAKDNRPEQKVKVQQGFSPEIPIPKNNEQKKIVCYYNVPTMYDTPFPVFPEQIDPFMCTHIIMAFGRVDNFTLIPNDPRDVVFYNRTTGLKQNNPNLKVLFCVGSTNDGSPAGQEFVDMMSSEENRAKFIKQSIQFLEAYNFDGIDIDWEFPSYNDGHLEEKQQLTSLLKEFRNYANKSKDFILTAAVPAPKQIVDIGYDIKGIAEAVDFINLMTYDFHYYSPLSPVTGPNSPLYNLTQEIGFFATLNLAWSAKYWYQNGMPADKIVVGIPLYGHSYTLVDERYHDYYSFAGGYGAIGQNGFVPYVTVCQFIEGGAQVEFHNETKEPYAYHDKEWVSYDNEFSVLAKAKFIKSMNFGGAMFYSLNLDDAWKVCKTSNSTFPLITTVKTELEEKASNLLDLV